MTIITGVKSPFVLGKPTMGRPSAETVRMNSDLGIDMIK